MIEGRKAFKTFPKIPGSDKYYDTGGTVLRARDFSSWDGRDHLGLIVNPGTYLIHVEATNFNL